MCGTQTEIRNDRSFGMIGLAEEIRMKQEEANIFHQKWYLLYVMKIPQKFLQTCHGHQLDISNVTYLVDQRHYRANQSLALKFLDQGMDERFYDDCISFRKNFSNLSMLSVSESLKSQLLRESGIRVPKNVSKRHRNITKRYKNITDNSTNVIKCCRQR